MASSGISVYDPGGTRIKHSVYRQMASDLVLSALLRAELSVFAVLECSRACSQDESFHFVL